jgi:hypothetical protein
MTAEPKSSGTRSGSDPTADADVAGNAGWIRAMRWPRHPRRGIRHRCPGRVTADDPVDPPSRDATVGAAVRPGAGGPGRAVEAAGFSGAACQIDLATEPRWATGTRGFGTTPAGIEVIGSPRCSWDGLSQALARFTTIVRPERLGALIRLPFTRDCDDVQAIDILTTVVRGARSSRPLCGTHPVADPRAGRTQSDR